MLDYTVNTGPTLELGAALQTNKGVVTLVGTVKSHEQTGIASAHAQRHMFLLAYLKVRLPILTSRGGPSSLRSAAVGQAFTHCMHMSQSFGPSYIGVGVRSALVTTEMYRQREPNSGVIARPDQPISASPAAAAAWMCERSGANRLGMPSYCR